MTALGRDAHPDRISKKVLVEALREIGYWDAWRGPNDQGNSRDHALDPWRLLSRFDPGAAQQLAELLRAVAAYAAGGVKALAAVQHSAGAARLLLQLR